MAKTEERFFFVELFGRRCLGTVYVRRGEIQDIEVRIDGAGGAYSMGRWAHANSEDFSCGARLRIKAAAKLAVEDHARLFPEGASNDR